MEGQEGNGIGHIPQVITHCHTGTKVGSVQIFAVQNIDHRTVLQVTGDNHGIHATQLECCQCLDQALIALTGAYMDVTEYAKSYALRLCFFP